MLCCAGQTLLLFYDQSHSQSPYRSGWRRGLMDRRNCLDDEESVLNSTSVCSLLLWFGILSTLVESFALFIMSSETESVCGKSSCAAQGVGARSEVETVVSLPSQKRINAEFGFASISSTSSFISDKLLG